MSGGFDGTRRLARLVGCVRFLLSAVLFVFAAGIMPGHAQTTYTMDCTLDSNAFQEQATAGFTSGDTYEVKGTCMGASIYNSTGYVTITGLEFGGEVSGTIYCYACQNLTISNLTVDGSTATVQGIQFLNGSFNDALTDVTVQNFPDSGVSICCAAGGVTVSGGKYWKNENCGIYVYGPEYVDLKNDVEVTQNGTMSNPGSLQGGLCVVDGASAELDYVNIHDNDLGAGLTVFQATADVSGGTIESGTSSTYPALLVERGSVNLDSNNETLTITGPGHANAILATPSSSIRMYDTAVYQTDASDSTILMADGSTLLSLGGNSIVNSAAGATAITVANDSTFHERNETALGTTQGADIIYGAGVVQVQSNMEVGTGASTPSTWTGSISMQQNSSFRMDGGITITGGVTLSQGSNGFFNTSNGGTNSVEGGITCPWTSTQLSHVSAPTKVTPNVATGTGPNQCLMF